MNTARKTRSLPWRQVVSCALAVGVVAGCAGSPQKSKVANKRGEAVARVQERAEGKAYTGKDQDFFVGAAGSSTQVSVPAGALPKGSFVSLAMVEASDADVKQNANGRVLKVSATDVFGKNVGSSDYVTVTGRLEDFGVGGLALSGEPMKVGDFAVLIENLLGNTWFSLNKVMVANSTAFVLRLMLAKEGATLVYLAKIVGDLKETNDGDGDVSSTSTPENTSTLTPAPGNNAVAVIATPSPTPGAGTSAPVVSASATPSPEPTGCIAEITDPALTAFIKEIGYDKELEGVTTRVAIGERFLRNRSSLFNVVHSDVSYRFDIKRDRASNDLTSVETTARVSRVGTTADRRLLCLTVVSPQSLTIKTRMDGRDVTNHCAVTDLILNSEGQMILVVRQQNNTLNPCPLGVSAVQRGADKLLRLPNDKKLITIDNAEL